ncbi:MAG: hypothetical protein AVO33_09740 [delta proteobacterium ML8_F1]|nr:MAG: hypothetical protein AVO33_09740 [delta proteobacterium ML8_F1]
MKKLLLLIFILTLIIVGCAQEPASQPSEEEPAVEAEVEEEEEPAEESSFPERPIEFVASYAPGGGHDTLMRTMLKIIQDEGISDASINVVNKPGGSGAVGMAYVNGHAGDGHYLMAATSSLITTPLTSDVGLTFRDLTPIARLGIDPELLLVNAESDYETLDDLINAGKVLNIGGTSTGGIEHIAAIKLQIIAGVDINYIPYQGDGEVVAALMGNQIDMVFTNPNSAIDYIKSGDFRPIAITTEERVDLMPDIPTFKELGYDIVVNIYRGVMAPGGVSDEVVAYYTNMIEELVATEEWQKDYIERNLIVEGYLPGEEFGEYLEEVYLLYEETLTELGLIK